MDWSSADPSGIPGYGTLALALADCKTQLPFLLFCKLFSSLWPFQTRMHMCVPLHAFSIKSCPQIRKKPKLNWWTQRKLSNCPFVQLGDHQWKSLQLNHKCCDFRFLIIWRVFIINIANKSAPIGMLDCIILHLNSSRTFFCWDETQKPGSNMFS